MKLFLLLFGLLLALPVTGQEHAPTATTCQADVAVWGDANMLTEYYNAQAEFVKEGTANKSDVSKLGLDEMNARITEMGTCTKVAPNELAKYAHVQNFYADVIGDRLRDFVERHNLWHQFVLEDAQGRR